jgi:ketosteroid isomerase-like protein
VKEAFLNLVDAVNNATGADTEKIIALLDKEYVFKGRDLEANSARLSQSLGKFETTNSNVKIEGIHSSCDLAYVIASYKRTLTDRETGEVKIGAIDKVGLFIMRKNSAGEWKLLVQKTDDGFAHWFYMPKENS